ncbi:putative plasma membrane G-protein coupled receptor [Scheffersomyces amazonensis]|uniref:putative plasma membrane G-protein coupled receptor n=1 Tax=Scheffersomyces amazonensis TaxID=1078765 RepID=UPI00315DE52D
MVLSSSSTTLVSLLSSSLSTITTSSSTLSPTSIQTTTSAVTTLATKFLPQLLSSLTSNYLFPRSYMDTHNQIEEFTNHQARVQRILATSSSCASISLCICGMYMFLAFDPKRLIFRHQLIFFLMFFDLVKAIILLLYPTRVLTHSTSYYNKNFCQIVGFFTATAIEGADIAILSFAVHTYLLIFKPNLTTKVKNSSRTEGGLYKYRFYVYGMSFFIPIILASLAFIHDTGYVSLVSWCYLPERPLWYRFVLSWVPRYCIVIIIVTFYVLIYYHVIKEFRNLGGVFTTMHKSQGHLHPKVSNDENPSFGSAIKYFLSAFKDRYFLKLELPTNNTTATTSTNALNLEVLNGTNRGSEPGESIPQSPNQKTKNSEEEHSDDEGESEDDDDDEEDIVEQYDERAAREEEDDDEEENFDLRQLPTITQMKSRDPEDINYHPEMQAANLANFRKRQRIIEKQMKSIFVYPFAYIFVWVFPFILHVTQINYEEYHGPIYWINCMAAFMQPFNGFVDTLVFFYREKPWKYTIMKNFEKEHRTKLDNFLNANAEKLRNNTSDGNESFVASSFIKNSLSVSHHYSETDYPKWRQWLNWLELPFFSLPTEENIIKYQTQYIENKLNSVDSNRSGSQPRNHPLHRHINHGNSLSKSNGKFSNAGITNKTHDFSNILSDDLGESEFTNNLGNFSFNYEKKKNSVSQKSLNLHPHQEVPLHLQRQTYSNGGRKPSVISSSNKSNRSSSRQLSDFDENVHRHTIEMKPLGNTKKDSSTSSSSVSPFSNRKFTGTSFGFSTNGTSNATNSANGNSVGNDSMYSSDQNSNDELDFLEFLKRGPPT